MINLEQTGGPAFRISAAPVLSEAADALCRFSEFAGRQVITADKFEDQYPAGLGIESEIERALHQDGYGVSCFHGIVSVGWGPLFNFFPFFLNNTLSVVLFQ